MELKLESIENGQPVTKTIEVHPASGLGQMVMDKGWPEVIIHNQNAYTLQEFESTSAAYLQATVCVFP